MTKPLETKITLTEKQIKDAIIHYVEDAELRGFRAVAGKVEINVSSVEHDRHPGTYNTTVTAEVEASIGNYYT